MHWRRQSSHNDIINHYTIPAMGNIDAKLEALMLRIPLFFFLSFTDIQSEGFGYDRNDRFFIL